jgi:homoaconitase/3-isopropylmalate dehydratase large subunit
MEIEIGNKQGHVVIDDNTGKIMRVLVKEGVKGKYDFRSFTSYKREGDKHYDMRVDTMVRKVDPQLEKDIMSGKIKYKTK